MHGNNGPDQTDASRWEANWRQIQELNLSDPHAAVARGEVWLAEETATAESGIGEGRARALRGLAYALRTAGAYERADQAFVEAEAAFASLGLDDDAARTRIGHVEALRYLGRYDDAIALAQGNLEYLQSRGPEFGLDAARQTVNLGLVLWRKGNLEQALARFEEAGAYGRKEQIRELDATASMNVGLLLTELGRYGEALKADQYAAQAFEALGARERQATVQMNLGLLRITRGEYGQALEALLASRALCEQLGLEPKRAAVDLVLARAYQALNLDAEAAAACDQAVETLRRHDLPFELANALLRNGQVAEQIGEYGQARKNLTEARVLFARIGNASWETMAQLAGLRVAVREANRPALGPLLSEVTEVATRLQELKAPDQAAAGYLLQGEIERKMGRLGPARASIRAALDIGQEISADGVLFQGHTAEGILLEPSDPDEARAAFERAVEHQERLRERARADDLKLAVVGQGVNLYERIARLLLGPADARPARQIEDRWRAAFRWLERGKSRGLLEEALSGPARPSTDTPRVQQARERVADLRARLNAAYNVRYSLEAAPAHISAATADELDSLERDLSQATRELQILLRGDRAADVSALIDVERVQSVLAPGTCLLEYVILDDEIACFVVQRDAFEVRRAVASRQAVERAASWLWFHIRKGTYGAEFVRTNQATLSRPVAQALGQLGDALLAPFDDVIGAASHVVVVPHSLLHGVPIHALTYRGGILLDAVTVSYAPSAAVFAATVGSGPAVAQAGPAPRIERPLIVAPEIPDLPWVQEEARRIAALFPEAVLLSGADATLERVRREAPGRDALHLATHGVFRSDNPTYSALELADGWLSVGELAELAGGRALVCLSACHTGMSGVGPHEELLGLTRAVLGAGAQALVASLWAANDDTAPAYMETLYAGLRAGKSRAASLRDAALQTRQREAHPYFWAPFILVGAP
jgi:CHAT domain-containing protein